MDFSEVTEEDGYDGLDIPRPWEVPTVEAQQACDRAYRLALVWCQYVGQEERLDSGIICDIVADLLVMAEAQYGDTAERVAGRALLNARAELDGDDLTTPAVQSN